jgi:uridylate kinase
MVSDISDISKCSRVLLKISGEMFSADGSMGYDTSKLISLASQLKLIHDAGIGIVIVPGGGNLLRGTQLSSDIGGDIIPQVNADYMGMLATVMNAIALKSVINSHEKINVEIFSALPVDAMCNVFSIPKALSALDNKSIVICAGGTGNPLFTTDSAAALRAIQLEADVLFKATKCDGIYDSDPFKNSDAKRYEYLNYDDALKDNLQIMDLSAFSLCRDHKMLINVFSGVEGSNSIANSVLAYGSDKKFGTLVGGFTSKYY